MARRVPAHARPTQASDVGGVDGNERLTSSIAVVIFVLLFVEGVTILQVNRFLSAHVFIGVMLIPPVLFKIASTSWRFVKYYWGDPEYRRKGPPQIFLRLLGPLVVVLTVAVLGTGVLLVVWAPAAWHQRLFELHRLTFILWIAVTTVHVLGHLLETARLAPRDWMRRTRRQVHGASTRQWALVTSVAAGLLAGLWVLPYAANWSFNAIQH
jgi:hypothetical protein